MPTFYCPIGGKDLVIQTGKVAEQANAAVTVRYGDTLVLVTVCCSREAKEGTDFLSLTVDYEERLYAAGKIPGSFFRREGRPSQEAILAARLTDRPLRPLFPRGFNREVQIVVTVLSADQENDPDILSIIGGSTAVTISDIPFNGPLGAVRVGYINGEFVINPSYFQLQDSLLDLVVAGTKGEVVMVEAGGKEVPEEIVLQAIKIGHEACKGVIDLQQEMRGALGKPKMEFTPIMVSPEVEEAVSSFLGQRLDFIREGKAQREEDLASLKKELLESLTQFPEVELLSAFESKVKSWVRKQILQGGLHLDGRPWKGLRPISGEVGLLPRTHGSGLFTKGGTQVLTIATLGSTAEQQILDTLSPEETKRFIHHYNFPPFSTGEVRRIGSPGRREIGHGSLVERAIAPVLPHTSDFPYTIRLVSEVLSSNGSTSMASVCSSTLSLMDAGVPLKAPVAGVAMGLIMEGDQYAILTDIAGVEDAYGDMDFKVAGTAQGITALQLDIKLQGLSYHIIEEALRQAKGARIFTLEKMKEVIPSVRPTLSPYAPKIYKMTIATDKIGYVIGFGGKTIKSIMEETKTTIDIENDGTVIVSATNEEMAKKAIGMIENLTRRVEVGEMYTGKVVKLLNQGAIVELFAGREGLVPLQELAEYRVRRVDEVVKVGDEIMVKVKEVDRQGRITLSRRAVFEGLHRVGKVRDSLAEPRKKPPHLRRRDRPWENP
jgi:polyribonucleotide nucleotidyltransferase